MNDLPLILGSSSTRRLELLQLAGYKVEKTIIADCNEEVLPKEKPITYVQRVALDKLNILTPKTQSGYLITADTISLCGGRILHKAENDEMVRHYMQLSSGKRHQVYTAVCCAKIIDGNIEQLRKKLSKSIVKFKLLSNKEIEDYVACKEGIGKSGGCTLQGISSRYIKSMSGSWSGILGLPLYEVSTMLNSLGYNK